MRNEVGNFQSALLGKIQSALTDVGNRPGEIDVPVPSIDRRQSSKRRHMLAVGPGGAVCEPARGLLGILCDATSHDKAGRQSLEVPLKRRRQSLVEVIDIEDRQSLGRRIGSEIAEVSVTARLHATVGRRRVGQIRRHHGSCAAKEGEGICTHSPIADRHEFRDPALALFDQNPNRVGPVGRKNPSTMCAA